MSRKEFKHLNDVKIFGNLRELKIIPIPQQWSHPQLWMIGVCFHQHQQYLCYINFHLTITTTHRLCVIGADIFWYINFQVIISPVVAHRWHHISQPLGDWRSTWKARKFPIDSWQRNSWTFCRLTFGIVFFGEWFHHPLYWIHILLKCFEQPCPNIQDSHFENFQDSNFENFQDSNFKNLKI